MLAETYLRRGGRRLRCFLDRPGIQTALWAAGYGLGGFFLSAAGIHQSFQPIAMGLAMALTGWQAVAMTLGAMLGYRVFWGVAGLQGTVLAAAGGMTALLLSNRKDLHEKPLFMALLAGAVTALLGFLWRVLQKEETDLFLYCLRILTGASAAALGNQLVYHRDCISEWIFGGVLTLGLGQVMPIPYLGLGYGAAGFLSVTGAFPAAALSGMGLDLAGITELPMTAVMCVAYLLRLIPFSDRWIRYLSPCGAYLLICLICGRWDPFPVPGLILGGGLGLLLPGKQAPALRRGPTAGAQVRLELSARVMSRVQSLLLEQGEGNIDRLALVQKAGLRACSRCPYRKDCSVRENLREELLVNPLSVTCRKTGRLVRELQRSQEQLRIMVLEQKKRGEYRTAMVQQYGFLSVYLQSLADRLPGRSDPVRASFCVQASARSRRKERANGDRCIAFPGVGCRYYVLLCDGMGTGLGAAEEGRQAADLLRQMLTGGLPAEFALRSFNSLLTLRGQAGVVTVDLCELRLDSGRGTLYKWGAAPSWIIRSGRAEKLGKGSPPPGLSVTGIRETALKLSMNRGEVLVLFSDGIDGEEALNHLSWSAEEEPGPLAERLLKRGCAATDDDATVAVVRLRPAVLAT